MISIQNVFKTYNKDGDPVRAVDDISLHIHEHEIFGIIGESGSGKSTFLRFINRLEDVDSGAVIVDGQDVTKLSGKQLRLYQKDIGMIFQHFNLIGNKTVEENVRLPLELHQHKNPITVEEALKFVNLYDKRQQYPEQLSGGQKQRVGIARALVTGPKILLCDEPTSALDTKTTDEIMHVLLNAHKKYGMTIVIVTHELHVIKALAKRCAVFNSGKLVDVIDVKRTEITDNKIPYYEKVLEALTQ